MPAGYGHDGGKSHWTDFVAFEDQNYTMAEDVIKGDRNVNDMERAIESRCLSLILRQQPVAKDLRQISTALRW